MNKGHLFISDAVRMLNMHPFEVAPEAVAQLNPTLILALNTHTASLSCIEWDLHAGHVGLDTLYALEIVPQYAINRIVFGSYTIIAMNKDSLI